MRALLAVGGSLALGLAACAQSEEAVPISGDVRALGPSQLEVVVGCFEDVRVEVDEGPAEVEIRGYGQGRLGGDCASTETVTLEEPLGDRRLVDGKTGRPVDVTRMPMARARSAGST